MKLQYYYIPSLLFSDIGECMAGSDSCMNGATCINTVGSYTCLCDVGWTGNVCDIGMV